MAKVKTHFLKGTQIQHVWAICHSLVFHYVAGLCRETTLNFGKKSEAVSKVAKLPALGPNLKMHSTNIVALILGSSQKIVKNFTIPLL